VFKWEVVVCCMDIIVHQCLNADFITVMSMSFPF
jgi:hypothetical protein